MENIILGLLLLQARTIYQLRKRINEGLNLMYSCSTGSIQAAIKKLLKNGYIEVTEIAENGKLKKLYTITDTGKQYFSFWVNSPIENNSAKNPELAKIYFMSFSEKENRIKLIERHIDELQRIHTELDKICKYGESMAAENSNEVLFYQLQTAVYGRDLMQFNIKWYKNFLKFIKGEANENIKS